MYNTVIADEPLKQETEDHSLFLAEARKRAVNASNYWRDTYKEAERDTAFIYGDQWDSEAMENRKGRPMLTLNKMGQFVYRIVGDQRQNVASVQCIPTGSYNGMIKNVDGKKEYKLSQVYEGLIRNIELNSMAPYHYKTAFQHTVEGGFGWLRVLTDYSAEDSFDLDLKIKSIRHRWSVSIDPDATEPDRSDMNYAFIHERITLDEFRERYPDGQISALQQATTDDIALWGGDKTITVSEYFIRKPIKRDLVLMSNGETYWLDEVKSILDELAEQGITVERKRKVNTFKVLWYKITGADVLDGPKEWCGTTIPIVPVWGKEFNINGKSSFRGLINDGKDAQRMHNYWMSAATERVALAPKAPWVGAAKNFEGYEDIWRTANVNNWTFLPYNPTAQGDRPIRTDPPSMPTSELQIAATSEEGIKSSIGIYDANLGNRSSETSGRAILARQQQGDTATFVFQDNLTLAQTRIYKILVDAIPMVYDGNRIVRMHFSDGQGDFVEINKTIIDDETGQPVTIHDLSVGKFDIAVTTGPQYLTQRQEAADSLMEFAKVVPAVAQIAPDLIAQNLDAPNMDIMAQRLKKMLPPNMLSPEEQEEIAKNTPQQQDAPPPPEMVMAQQKMQFETQMQQMKLEEENIKLQTAQINAQGKAVEVQTKAAESQRDEQMEQTQIKEMVNEAVAEALAAFIYSQRQ